jgi:predicted transcriptional regulator
MLELRTELLEDGSESVNGGKSKFQKIIKEIKKIRNWKEKAALAKELYTLIAKDLTPGALSSYVKQKNGFENKYVRNCLNIRESCACRREKINVLINELDSNKTYHEQIYEREMKSFREQELNFRMSSLNPSIYSKTQ